MLFTINSMSSDLLVTIQRTYSSIYWCHYGRIMYAQNQQGKDDEIMAACSGSAKKTSATLWTVTCMNFPKLPNCLSLSG